MKTTRYHLQGFYERTSKSEVYTQDGKGYENSYVQWLENLVGEHIHSEVIKAPDEVPAINEGLTEIGAKAFQYAIKCAIAEFPNPEDYAESLMEIVHPDYKPFFESLAQVLIQEHLIENDPSKDDQG